MKGDPRRLTLPLQRMKKMGMKLLKKSKDSMNLEDGRERSSSEDLEKEDQEMNENVDECEDLEAEIDSSSDKPSSSSRNEDGKTGKLETPVCIASIQLYYSLEQSAFAVEKYCKHFTVEYRRQKRYSLVNFFLLMYLIRFL